MTVWCSVDEAAQSVPDGAWLAPGGFMLGRAPMALVFGLIRARRRGLRTLSLPNPLPAELLVATGAAARVELLFGALTLANRVRQARTRLRSGGNSEALAKVEGIATTLFGPDEGVRYGRPGLQTQITYLAGMTTRVDQRIGRDAIERYQTLRKELDAVKARAAAVLAN